MFKSSLTIYTTLPAIFRLSNAIALSKSAQRVAFIFTARKCGSAKNAEREEEMSNMTDKFTGGFDVMRDANDENNEDRFLSTRTLIRFGHQVLGRTFCCKVAINKDLVS